MQLSKATLCDLLWGRLQTGSFHIQFGQRRVVGSDKCHWKPSLIQVLQRFLPSVLQVWSKSSSDALSSPNRREHRGADWKSGRHWWMRKNGLLFCLRKTKTAKKSRQIWHSRPRRKNEWGITVGRAAVTIKYWLKPHLYGELLCL